MTLAAGTKIGRYEIHSQIGAGGMGHVYKARDTSELNRTVAIKLLPTEVASDPKRMQRFIREARTVSGLNHPNVLTIYEFGRQADTRFIAMEFVEGLTLREYLREHLLTIHEVIEIAMQIAAALDAAHEAHVVHRDIKPENIMVRRRDHIIKVLDFGLAKPVKALRSDTTDPSTGTKVPHTEPGIVMGTLSYMSPEQATGATTLDYRTDIWSLGAVLYEMVTGRVPFAENELHKQIEAIQEKPHEPMSTYVARIPERLEEIVTKTLAKNPNDRYRTANELLVDLRNLKRKLEVNAEVDRTELFDNRMATTISGQHVLSSNPHISAPPVSSAEYIVNQVKSHKRGVLIVLALFIMAGIVGVYFFMKQRGPALLTDKDTILLSEFENKTGEEVFDGTLRQGLAVQLQQSPFLDIFPDQRVRATLQLMSLSPDEQVTRDRAREICQRQGLKAFIAGTIVKFDRNYSITLEALNGQTGDVLALVQVEAEGKDQVLRALSRAASELREKLGESLSSIKRFDAKLEVTTSSLEALKDYAQGRGEQDRGQSFKAIEFYQRATEKDPNFATAWLGLALQYANTSQPGLASESLSKAFALVDRVSEDERARITYFYYQIVTGELDKAIEAQEAYTQTYPRESRGPGNLGNLYSTIGEYEKAVSATREAQRINPNTTIWPGNLAEALIALNRFAEAKDVCDRAIAQKLISTSIRERLYSIAFVAGDTATQQEQLDWAKGRTDEYRAVYWQAQSSAFQGKWKQAEENLKRATEIALKAEATEVVASYTAETALRAAWSGQFPKAISLAESALNIEHNRIVLTRSALALALAGDTAKAQSLIQELVEKYPKDLLVNQLWLPEIRAVLELRNDNAQGALDLLEQTRRFEPAAVFVPQTLRIMAYLKLGKAAEASAEARKIFEHRGEGSLSMLWPLAYLYVARASAMQGDMNLARKSYQDFFALWKEADPDIPILIEARKEFEKLK